MPSLRPGHGLKFATAIFADFATIGTTSQYFALFDGPVCRGHDLVGLN
jgi:hypothetical protein